MTVDIARMAHVMHVHGLNYTMVEALTRGGSPDAPVAVQGGKKTLNALTERLLLDPETQEPTERAHVLLKALRGETLSEAEEKLAVPVSSDGYWVDWGQDAPTIRHSSPPLRTAPI